METSLHAALSLVRGVLNDRSVPSRDRVPTDDIENSDFDKLYVEIAAVRETLKQFASGNLDHEIMIRGAVAGYLKTLQANLRHLTWQVEKVAAGDFTQRLDFLGEFSNAFNAMTVRMEQLLKDSKERERQLLLEILDCCPICFAVLVDEKVRFATPFMKRFLEIDMNDRLADFLVPPELGPQLMTQLDAEQIIQWHPSTFQTKSGQTKEMLIHLFRSNYYDEPGTMVWMVDVTQIRQTEAELRRARDTAEELAKLKGEFLANMSHEIRTPMNAILGMTHLMHQTDLSEKQSVYVKTAEKSAKLLLEIINDILDFSKIEAGKLELKTKTFVLDTILQEALSVVTESAEEKHLQLLCNFAPDLPEIVVGDSVRFAQVLLNLLNNAIKFTTEGSIRLCVRIDHSENDAVILFCSVSDTGIGMSEEALERLFVPFMQADNSMSRRYGGTGLGLAICKNLVEMMGGTIWCESRENEGSTFYFTVRFLLPDSSVSANGMQVSSPEILPRADIDRRANAELARDTEDRRVVIPKHLSGMPILLVEDNKINQLVAIELLTLKGFSVDVAQHGRQALEKIQQKSYGLVLMDIQMPEMDGFQATRLIRQNPQWADLPILAMTANAMAGDRELCLEAGMNDHIAKPINPTTLYRQIVHWAKPPHSQ